MTRIRSWVPARKLRCIARSRTAPALRLTRSDTALRASARGHALPRQRATIAVPVGARTERRRMRAPRRVSVPAMRTTGNGEMNAADPPTDADPVDWKPRSSPAAVDPGATAVGELEGAVAVVLGRGRVVVVGLGRGLAGVVVGGDGRGAVVVVVGVVVVVETSVVVSGTSVVVSGTSVVSPPPVDVSPPGSPSWARPATGPSASSAPSSAATANPSGRRPRERLSRR